MERRLSGEYEFRNLMFELDFFINYDEIKEKRRKKTEASKKEGVADMNQSANKEKDKVSKEDVGKGMGEPKFQHVLEDEVEVDGELYHVQIDKRVLDEIEEAEIDSLIQEATSDLLEIVKEDDFDHKEIIVDWLDDMLI